MDDHNDFAGMIAEMTFDGGRPYFYFFNLGETHYPYMLDDPALPRVSGVHGVVRNMSLKPAARKEIEFFDQATMARLREQQVRCVEHVDRLLPQLFEKCPPGTHVIVTADHGEMFGEEGYFGHGPVMHPKVFEVPFVEGKVPPH
jgi:membrane-anchored protein YejM (alkaline phosphatase superfamily)